MKLFCAMYLYIYVHICIYAKRKASHQGIIKSMEIPNISIFFPERVSGGASSGFLMSSCSSCCIGAHFSAFLRVMITCVENYLEQPCCIFLLGLTQATLVSPPPENVKMSKYYMTENPGVVKMLTLKVAWILLQEPCRQFYKLKLNWTQAHITNMRWWRWW